MAIIEADTSKTTREVAEELNVDSMSTVVWHLKKIGKVKKLDKWVPHELNENQKYRRFEVSSSLLLRNQNYPFFNRIVTCAEKWVLYDNRKKTAVQRWFVRFHNGDESPEDEKHGSRPSKVDDDQLKATIMTMIIMYNQNYFF